MNFDRPRQPARLGGGQIRASKPGEDRSVRTEGDCQKTEQSAEQSAQHKAEQHKTGQNARQKSGAPTRSNAEMSAETGWMLAVRDTRCKVAFGHLFDHFAPRLKGVICRSGLSHVQAEDIVQDVMLTVWHKAAQFDPERAQVSAWIYQIARNRQVDILRKTSRPVPEELKSPEQLSPDASQIVALDQEVKALRVALGALKPAQREMLEQAYLGELTHAEIRDKTGLPLGTIKSRIRLGLEKLRHELKERAGR